MLPSILARQLEKGIKDYIETSFPMMNEPFKGSVQEMLQHKGALCHEPYVAVRLPFRVAEAMPSCFEAVEPAYLPYVHQQKAFERLTGDDGRSTLIATGTGSGKTECFLYPVLEYCYRHRGERGIKALLIYPMNALANDQAKRIAALIHNNPKLRGSVTAGMYVGGQEDTPSRTMSEDGIITDHETLLNSSPDILLTNYKMLDYLLVRPKDALLWQDNKSETLKYIAVDELHTFDGAQGTDLACLLRRLKRRLDIYGGYLCCIGTSATMGTKENSSSILDYAEKIFGEPFDKDAIITEDRLSAEEFFAGSPVSEFEMPSAGQAQELGRLSEEDPSRYLQAAVQAWFPEADFDIFSDEGRIRLGELLMQHSFMQAVIHLTGGNYYQASKITEDLAVPYPDLKNVPDASVVTDSLYALISHARTGTPGKVRPFLNVQVQVWMRELRRLVARVGNDVTYGIMHDLNSQQAKQYLPVVNCRDCGLTGWVTILNSHRKATMPRPESFYNLYFKADKKICMLFPMSHSARTSGTMERAWICPECMQVKQAGKDSKDIMTCDCGAEMLQVLMPAGIELSGTREHKQYVCPFCGSRRGLSLMGVRSATEISAGLSQMFVSKFNDDKKVLAFSDSVQDAAHKAGFFNSRTWRFGLRGAIQKYCMTAGAGQSLAEFQEGFLKYWHSQMSRDEFASFFIAPNMVWKSAYEEMLKKRRFGSGKLASSLMYDIGQRLKYEIMLEFGISCRAGRTLERSGCCVLSFDTEDIISIAHAVQSRAVNETGSMKDEGSTSFIRMVAGFLTLLRMNGAFADKVFDGYTANDGKNYLLASDKKNYWLPMVQSGRNTPRFLYKIISGLKSSSFDLPGSGRYADWIKKCSHEVLVAENLYETIGSIILEEALKQSVLLPVPSSAKYKLYGLNKDRVFVSGRVVQMRCTACGSLYAVAEEQADLWEGAPCLRAGCKKGTLSAYKPAGANYYATLYSSGDMVRINAREHTGLLERPEREQLETDFKRGRDSRKLWDPNVLSCTPTLEMGIDIGDLSTVILCSMPPARSQFLQRAGRAGRKNGNALTLVIANARPHDLYFYADPMEMISGSVTPPEIFLRASAVLERQFVAFCMDSWVKKDLPEEAIPEKVGAVLRTLKARKDDTFPFNFLKYVQGTLSLQINTFMQMFAADLDDGAKEELQAFARGNGPDTSPMHIKILDAFEDLKKQQNALKASVKKLKDMRKELEAKPKDSSYEEEIKKLKGEEEALQNVSQELGRKNIFNFLSDEGLLPNYAFPEAGIVLRAVLYRKEEQDEAQPKKKYEKMVYEYNRSASSAISEFAPKNSFYAEGRKLTIDQIDLTTAQITQWRLCPNCSHAQIEETGRSPAACPQCGSPGWADAGQVRPMLKVQMVYSNTDYTKSLINDEREDRTNVFYCKQLLVDVDEEHDITAAYQMDNDDFPFGYEFARKATLREINFGESDMTGEPLSVSGVEDIRKGFRVCKYCGKIQPDDGKPVHTFACKARTMPALLQSEAFEECLFLYREFTTEILRLLIPATTMDATKVRLESFIAAFMLGMKEYFGNVDHLGATVSEVPVPDADYRKQYLVIYDSVPGGTGYLKQLMHKENALTEIFEKALHVMENCSCREDPQKDGCYHCLYAYRQSQQMGNISRATAIRLLKSVLSGKDHVEKISRIGDIQVNPLFDSELELRFLEAVRLKAGADNVKDILRGGKHSYYLKFSDTVAWEIEPQVMLDGAWGVAKACKPDFVFWPASESMHKKPVAVFTDGFLYHKDIVADDTIKREAIRRSGNFHVWSLSFKDVQNVFTPQGDYVTESLAAEKMPCGPKIYQNTIKQYGATAISPGRLTSFDLLLAYLKLPDAEDLFTKHARAYGLSLLNPGAMKNQPEYTRWKRFIDDANDQIHLPVPDWEFDKTVFGRWMPEQPDSNLTVYAGISTPDLKAHKSVVVCAVLRDAPDERSGKYEHDWNGFWRFFNVMQFAENFMALSSAGLAGAHYHDLPAPSAMLKKLPAAASASGSTWDNIMELLFDEGAKDFARFAQGAAVPAPDTGHIGYEAEGKNKEVLATIEIAWPDRKVGFMTDEQLEDREKAEAHGWKILSVSDMADADITKLFGGDA